MSSELPIYLAERLAEDQAKFGSNQTKEQLQENLDAHTKRHEALLAEKSQHAKEVGGHPHHPHHELESNVKAKQFVVEEQANELKFLQERIIQVEAKERELKERLGVV